MLFGRDGISCTNFSPKTFAILYSSISTPNEINSGHINDILSLERFVCAEISSRKIEVGAHP